MPKYEKLDLKNGTIVDETHFAHIEQGIEDAMNSIPEDVYTKDEIDEMFGEYVTEVAALVGGDA